MDFLRWLFGWRCNRVNRNITTRKFYYFEEYYKIENAKKGKWESHTNLLTRYMLETKSSPFLGDDDLSEAKAFLRENGVSIDISS